MPYATVSPLAWIVLGGMAMCGIALVGSLTLLLKEETLERVLHPTVALAAGTLLGGAFFHMLPSAGAVLGPNPVLFGWAMLGFSAFFLLEQVLSWHHHRRRAPDAPRPLTHLILLADGRSGSRCGRWCERAGRRR